MSSTSFDSTELPVLNVRTHCVLIARDPHFIYAYWDYTEKDINNLQNGLGVDKGAPKFVLRVYDITAIGFDGSSAKHSWDIDVGFSARNCYIHAGQDNADYCVEIGLSLGEGHFSPLVRSNMVHTPPKTASKRDDLIWQDIKFYRESMPYVRENVEAKREARKKAMQRPRTYELTGEDIDTYYMKLLGSSQQGDGVPSMEQILKAKWPGVSWEKVRSLMKAPDLIRRLHPGASEKFLGEAGAGEEQAAAEGGTSELLAISSQAGAPGGSEERLKKRKFFFEVWTELIVHGRTEPDAVVWLNSKGVKLNPDGTFSLRYALPDGEIPLQFIAQSSDTVEQRHIYTRVERSKTIGFPKMLKEFRG